MKWQSPAEVCALLLVLTALPSAGCGHTPPKMEKMDPKLLFYDREQTHFTPLRPQRVAAGQLPLLITIAQGGAMRVVESASGREIWKFTVPDHALIGLNDRHLSINGHITQNLSLKLNNQYELWFDPQP